MNKRASVRLLRHATLIIKINDKRILVDPMLSPKDGLDPVQNCGNEIRFPMVELPIDKIELDTILESIDAVIVSHLHRDHWDSVAQDLIDKGKLIFCQPGDAAEIKKNFKNVQVIESRFEWEGITIFRTKGQHGTGEIGKKMGEVSGFVLKYQDGSIYLAGDTIWCEDVENSLLKFRPEVTIVNAGGAKFLIGNPITMTPQDIIQLHDKFPDIKIIAVHMDTVNHCFDKRTHLKSLLSDKKITSILVPDDGQIIEV